jgi:hypothetical protein
MRFDRSLIKILLGSFGAGEQHYTHSLSHCCSSFNGKDNRPLLRKYLRHMEEKGYILNHDLGHNTHKWSITQDGIDTLKLLETDPFN